MDRTHCTGRYPHHNRSIVCLHVRATRATRICASDTACQVGGGAAKPKRRSALSYGTVTTAVTKGKTTQLELIQMFGGPNISTLDGDGLETWVYERSVSQTDVASKSQNWQAAANLGVAFGHVQAGVSAGGGQSQGASSTASSFRSLTAIVKFNADKTVKDYSVRASQF